MLRNGRKQDAVRQNPIFTYILATLMRTHQLTFTRFVAAFAIVVFHFGQNVSPFSQLNFLFSQANLGVSFFYLLSGFVMMIAYKKKQTISSTEYFQNRFARVYPLYVLALLVCFFIFSANNKTALGLGLLGLQAWSPRYALDLNVPGWSISVEAFFYLTFPFLFNNFYRRQSFKTVCIGIGIVWVLSQVAFHLLINSKSYQPYPSNEYAFAHYFPLLHLNEFLVGNLLGLLYCRLTKGKNYDIHLVVLAFSILALLKLNLPVNYHNGLLAILFGPFIYLLALNTGKITSVFSKKPMVYLGEISYGVYILQFPVYIFCQRLFNTKNSDGWFYSYVGILLGASVICYHVVENPLRELLKARHKKVVKPSNSRAVQMSVTE